MGALVCKKHSSVGHPGGESAPCWVLLHRIVAPAGAAPVIAARAIALQSLWGQAKACAKMMHRIDLGRSPLTPMHHNGRLHRSCPESGHAAACDPRIAPAVVASGRSKAASRHKGCASPVRAFEFCLASTGAFERAEKGGKFPAKALDSRICGFFRCIGATGDCPMRKARIRLRRSVICRVADTPIKTTNKGNQP